MTGNQRRSQEFYVSIDVETAGPYPPAYSLLSLGACTVFEPLKTFYAELQPINDNFLPEALQVSGLSLAALKVGGRPPQEAMTAFAAWLDQATPPDRRAVFVAFNAPFDWMFVNDYFHRCLGHNPFGHAALDVKAFYMGLSGCSWGETSMQHITRHYLGERQLSHHALQDALDQAEIFRLMLADARRPGD